MYFVPYSYVAYPYYYPQWQAYNNESVHPRISLQSQNQFPPVDTKQLHTSAEKFQEIIREARLLIDKIVSTPSFASELMDAAQLSNHKKVDELIASTGISIKVETTFSPTGIQIEFDNSKEGSGCCKLDMSLLW